jgi:glycosyltransferase involved in cell wall biosynthesis
MSRLVSILIPAYNAERWVFESVTSALTQSWNRVEIIAVDDASKDGTLATLRAIKSSKLKVIANEVNRGASASRNIALAAAQGDYIQWLDADDLIAPDKIELQMREAEQAQDSRRLFSAPFGEFLTRAQRAHFRSTPLWQDLDPTEYLCRKFSYNAWLNPAVWLASRNLTALAGPWNEQLSLDDDGEYFSRLVSKSSGIRFVPQARVYYRRNNINGISRGVKPRDRESLLTSLQLCIGYLRALEDSPRTRDASVRLLQHWIDTSDMFFPDEGASFERARIIAQAVGGDLQPHRIAWKYAPVRALFGWDAARRLRRAWSNFKLLARVRIEELLSRGSQEIR